MTALAVFIRGGTFIVVSADELYWKHIGSTEDAIKDKKELLGHPKFSKWKTPKSIKKRYSKIRIKAARRTTKKEGSRKRIIRQDERRE